MQNDPLSATLFALADATRRGILAQLASGGDATVNELAAPYAMSLAAVSKHLKVLEGAGLISRGRDAQRRPCHLQATPLREVSAWLDDYRRFWERSMDAFADYLEVMKTTVTPTPTPTPTATDLDKAKPKKIKKKLTHLRTTQTTSTATTKKKRRTTS